MQNEYPYYRNMMQTGDLIETASDSIIGRAIRFFTKRDVNHSAFLLRIEEFKTIKDRIFLLEALKEGLEWTAMSASLKGYKGQVYWHRLIASPDQRDKMAAFAIQEATKKRKNKEYDYESLFRNIFGAVSADARKYFCSEFYFYCLLKAGLVDVDVGKAMKAPRPGDFGAFKLHAPRVLIYTSRKEEEK